MQIDKILKWANIVSIVLLSITTILSIIPFFMKDFGIGLMMSNAASHLFKWIPIFSNPNGNMLIFFNVVVFLVNLSLLAFSVFAMFGEVIKKSISAVLSYTSIVVLCISFCSINLNKSTYTLQFMKDENSSEVIDTIKYVHTQEVSYLEFPEAPSKEGHVFTGWKTKSGKTVMSVNEYTRGNMKLYPSYLKSDFSFSMKGFSINFSKRVDGSVTEKRNYALKIPNKFFSLEEYEYHYSLEITAKQEKSNTTTVTASGGHITNYEAVSHIKITADIYTLYSDSYTTKLGFNWFGGGSTSKENGPVSCKYTISKLRGHSIVFSFQSSVTLTSGDAGSVSSRTQDLYVTATLQTSKYMSK